jgi:hypothetical protein
MLSFPATADLPVIPGTLDAEGRGVVHVPWAPTSWTIGRPACLATPWRAWWCARVACV